MNKCQSFLHNKLTLNMTIFGVIGLITMVFLFRQSEIVGQIPIQLKVTFKKAEATLEIKNCSGFHLITFFPLISAEMAAATDMDLLLRREKEYMDTLVSNLNHPVVCKVYVLSNQSEGLQRLFVKEYGNIHPNLKIHKSRPSPLYEDIFRFASENLLNKVVVVLNADIQLGKGFDKVDKNWWKDHPKTMHALTRQLPLSGCNMDQIGEYCTHKKAKYVGSHDAFLFYLKDPFPTKFLKEINFPPNHLGADNVLIWTFRNILNFKVTNPCLKLFVHQNQCSGLKSYTKSNSVNTNGRIGVAKYSATLE